MIGDLKEGNSFERQNKRNTNPWYSVGVLVALYVVSFFGRQIISLMVDPIERSLHLTEMQIGMLLGFAFTLLFTVGGIAFGWLVDLYSRRLIIFFGTIAWSISCIACGFASSFTELFVARMGVGIGEATLLPAAYSFLSSAFPRQRLAGAVGIFSFGAVLGVALSLGLGGFMLGCFIKYQSTQSLLMGLKPWQAAFVLAGVAGLISSFLALSLPEPPRAIESAGPRTGMGPLLELLKSRSILYTAHFAGFSSNALMGYSLMAWAPAFMGRAYGWPSSEVGPAIALALGISGTLATVGGGFAADYVGQRGVRGGHFLLASGALALAVPFGPIAFLSAKPWIFLIGISAIYFSSALCLNMGATSLQLFTPPTLRGRLSGLYAFCTNIIGAGLGPLIVASITQHVLHDAHKVGIAMAFVIPLAGLAGATILGLARNRYAEAIAVAA